MWIFRWLISAIYAKAAKHDLRYRKSLAEAIPNLDRLLADPAGTLAAGNIAIGPQRRPAAVWVTGLLMAVVFWLVVAGTTGAVWKTLLQGVQADDKVLFPATVAAAIALATVYTKRRYRGGHYVLTRDGLELTARGNTVFCPWSLFHVAGQPSFDLERGSNYFVRWFAMPVWPEAVPHVAARREGVFLFAQGIEVNTRQFRFRSANEAELRAWYEVSAQDLAALLLRLAKTLGAALPQRAVTPQELRDTANRLAPAATLDGNGWLVASLTRLAFPPLCCGCGRPTETHHFLAARKPIVRLGKLLNVEGEHAAWVSVPLCGTCQDGNRLQHRQWVRKRVRIAFTGPLFLGLLIAPLVAFRNLGAWLCIELLLLLVVSLPGALIAYVLARGAGERRIAPVRVERFSPSQGTVAIRFERPGYAEQVLAATTAAGTGTGDGVRG